MSEFPEEYVKEQELSDDEKLREILLQKQELKLRSRVIFFFIIIKLCRKKFFCFIFSSKKF